MLGNERLRVFPVWEMEFSKLAKGSLPIATEKVKHDTEYQELRGVLQGPAEGLPAATEARLKSMAKRIYRTLALDGYARIDFRLSEEGVPYFIEANPNPEIAKSEEFAQSALHDGLAYPDLLNRIVGLAIKRAGGTQQGP